MDSILKAAGGSLNTKEGESNKFMDSINNVAGGGEKSEQQEDGLDKAVDFVQEKVLGQGQQNNETAAEQAKDEAISDYIRDKYKDTTGSDFPIADKEKKFGL
ncbi:hypothetical protein ISF_01129 [Cordyceps fumosorosea ARSEF 2679]|uniref:Uncharacterized protein n=1 Tax=Cordyceps fumosorosea (strain ARSEF 2679) TaxID=1081104 RepID=A0A162KFN3_CORFA|nr:hypothetical protein ISF_01129 [Cordyceps fumosorosea ARSEF 2679]OAA74228.1 hypothetical protein ISF_01129 [Cordyceps fumosorosea ARSEF 2679]